jgi:hypothetical protein
VKALGMVADGATYREAGRAIDVHEQTVYEMIRKERLNHAGVTVRDGSAVNLPGMKSSFKRSYCKGVTHRHTSVEASA